MSSSGSTCAFWALLVAACWAISEACLCMPEHPQQKYCKASFVLKGLIMDDADTPDNQWNITEMVPRSVAKDFLTYYVQVERIFKGQNGITLNSAGIVEIKTPQSASLCGDVVLEKGRNYLLSGKNMNGTLVIDRCDWVVAHRDMTKKQRQSVRFFFKQSCQVCEIRPCFNPEQCQHLDSLPNSCTYDVTHLLSGLSDCEGQHSRCTRSSDGNCRWARSSQMRECLKQRTLMEVNRPILK